MSANYLNPPVHVTREEIRLTIHLHVMTLYRHYFLRQELDKILNERLRLDSIRSNNSNGGPPNGLVYDRVQVSKSINAKLQSHRSPIRRNAHYIDNILYERAGTIAEYSNLNDLEERTNEVLAALGFVVVERY